MPRARNAPPQRDDNQVVLTEEDFEALQHHYEMKLATEMADAAAAAALAKSKQKAVGNTFKMVTAELGYTRDSFERYLIDKRRPLDEFDANEAQRDKMYKRGGLKDGEQGELNLGDTAEDEARAMRDGYDAGKNAREPVPPPYISPVFHPLWQEYWHKGQEDNIRLLDRAARILAERDKPAAEPEAEEPEKDFDPDAEARRLKGSGFMDTSGGEGDEEDDSEHAQSAAKPELEPA